MADPTHTSSPREILDELMDSLPDAPTGGTKPQTVVSATLGDAAAPKRRRDAAKTRADLLDAARRLVAEHGSHGVSTRMVANAAGVNQALVYRYFGSKEALLSETVMDEAPPFSEVFADHDLDDLPHAIARRLAEKSAGNDLGKLALVLAASNDESIRAEVRAGLEEKFGVGLGGLLAGPDAALRAELVAAAAFGIGFMRVKLGTSALAAADVDTLTEHVAAMLAPLMRTAED
ncbi:TetR/AcrR family transcriptional regulator [Nocardioides yefusunii]|uniref:TetR/AcrR family transcriptional regulator n=1 Tax=Nocardioides yefusunii TaxID=2500546 RepID=A0ABW1QZ87_9ACTN|nr:TetR/AcrR family transcriptional regulator [Nocardioides yefusunii]